MFLSGDPPFHPSASKQCCGSRSKGSPSFCRIRIHNIFHGSGSLPPSLPSSFTLNLSPLLHHPNSLIHHPSHPLSLTPHPSAHQLFSLIPHPSSLIPQHCYCLVIYPSSSLTFPTPFLTSSLFSPPHTTSHLPYPSPHLPSLTPPSLSLISTPSSLISTP